MDTILKSLGSRAVVWIASACLLLGVGVLESAPRSPGLGYALSLFGAALFVFLPSRVRCSTASQFEWKIGAVIAAVATVFLIIRSAAYVLSAPRPGMGAFPLLSWWLGATVLVIVAAFCLDRSRNVRLPTLPRGEVIFCLALFVVAMLVRSVGTPTLVADEALHAVKVLFIPETRDPAFLGALKEDGYPHALLHVFSLLHQATGSVVSLVTLLKWVSYACGALSIVLWYAVVRLYSGRVVAIGCAVLLVLFGWHWINTRFAYAYPIDLAVIALAALSLTVALRTGSLTMAALSGVSLAVGFLLQKSGLLLVPFLGYIGLEALLAAPKEKKRQVLLVGAALAVAFCVAYEPAIIDHATGSYSMPLQDRAVRERAEVLPRLGLTPTTALGYMFYDAFRQFQVSMHDFPRHAFRPNEPLLDPVFSALFVVGFVSCIASVRRSMAARLCLIGLVLFILPMAFSFPVNDDQRGLARRMLGTSFFLAWIAALGAVAVVSRFCEKRSAAIGAVALCAASALINVWQYFTVYSYAAGFDWYSSGIRGIQSAAVVDLALAAEQRGLPTVVLEGPEASLLGLPDSKVRKTASFLKASSVADVRAALLAKPGVLQMVIVPWDSRSFPRDSQAVVQELSDIVPPYLWIAGRADPDGIPMLRYAFVRVK